MSKALLESYIDVVWNQKKFEVIPRVVSDDVVIHASIGTYYGSKAMQHLLSAWSKAFPDFKINVKSMICEKNVICVHFTFQGTHKGEIFQIPASHKVVQFSGVSIYRFTDSMITEYWTYFDTHRLRLNLLESS